MMKNEFLQSIKDTILKNNLLSPGDSVLVAVSGGADSICLLDVLNKLKDAFALSLYVAHVNHMLRAGEATRDAEFVRTVCKQYDIPFYYKEIDVANIAKRNKISCEEAGRIARYDFFLQLKTTLSIHKIATAHNKNDNIETVCMRFLRGTGINGLGGIPIVSDRGIIRPLLHTSRTDIEEYIAQNKLVHITDSSNLTDDYMRNRIRHSFVPNIIENYNNNFMDTLHENILSFCETSQYLKNQVDTAYKTLVHKQNFGISFDLDRLLQEDVYIIKALIKKAVFTCTKKEITSKILRLLYENVITGDACSFAISPTFHVYKKYKNLYFVLQTSEMNFTYKSKQFENIKIEETGDAICFSYGSGPVSFKDKNVIYIKESLCVGKTLTIRNRKTCDSIYLGYGHKGIKDLMIDEKVPCFLRDKIPLLLLDEELVWVCGIRDNPAFRANENEAYIKITYSKEKANE